MVRDRVWLPLQGGLPPVTAAPGTAVEIACDESGFSGTNLLDPVTPVITHASVDLRIGEAADLISALRTRFRYAPDELKSGRFLRGPRAPEALEWLLSALSGRAHVHLVDKEYFLVTRIVDLLLAEPSYAAGTRLTRQHRPAALSLYRAGRPAGADWTGFLAAFVDMTRTKRRHHPDRRAFDRFFHARDTLAGHHLGAPADGILTALGRNRVWTFLTRLSDDDPAIPPPLEPMLPALAETVLFWSAGHRQVLVSHDEQSALTAGRLRRLQQALAADAGLPPAAAGRPPSVSGLPPSAAGLLPSVSGLPPSALGEGPVSPLAGLVAVDSRDDPRVQVADLLAGIARRLPETAGGPLQPFLSPTSLRDPQR